MAWACDTAISIFKSKVDTLAASACMDSQATTASDVQIEIVEYWDLNELKAQMELQAPHLWKCLCDGIFWCLEFAAVHTQPANNKDIIMANLDAKNMTAVLGNDPDSESEEEGEEGEATKGTLQESAQQRLTKKVRHTHCCKLLVFVQNARCSRT
jgi:hypothetical protein